MRVGLVIDVFDPHRGGAEHWTFQWAQWLLARGHEVHVVAQRFTTAGLQLPIIPHCLGRIRSRRSRAAAAEARLRRLHLDIIHDMGMGWYCDVLEPHDGSQLAIREQKLLMVRPWLRPLLRRVVRLLPRYRALAKLQRCQFASRPQLVLALSQRVARDYRLYHGLPERDIRLVYNGVDTERFSPGRRQEHRAASRRQLGIRPGAMCVLFIAHNHRLKGLPTAIRAVQRMASQGEKVHLVVVGGKPGRAAHGARTNTLGNVVTYVGVVQDTLPYYAAADVFVLPTYSDACSLTVLEAAACGVPSVTTQFNGVGELLTDGVNGYVLSDPADDSQLANRLRMLLDSAQRRQMGQAARQLALRHTLDSNFGRILAVYAEIIDRKADHGMWPAAAVQMAGDRPPASPSGHPAGQQRPAGPESQTLRKAA